ncbi:MAG: thiamine pyrophosphate-dependent enzyme [Marinilabiliales bacterium]|nr:thiamine pyrophosphate-dependent enzyme [Marinilabiliales bacterium]
MPVTATPMREGLDHLIFAAKRNIDITVIVHNNRVYGLTTGQYTPTSPLGFKGKSTPVRHRGISHSIPVELDACKRGNVYCTGIYQKDGPVKEARLWRA